jgi:glycosyltransferase involved in cell wall biosynthesis
VTTSPAPSVSGTDLPRVRTDRRGWREVTPPVPDDPAVEVSVVMPCLNEAETLEGCVTSAARALAEAQIRGEIIVADNGSTDGSPAIAAGLGVRVIEVAERGYGSALMGGIRAARGRFVIMGDADASYDFAEIPTFVRQLRLGFDIVQGCRLETGGGTVQPNAMRFLHRWWGNPMFSRMARWWFRAPIHDIHCGMRGFDRQYWFRLDQHCTGMEFASEMIIKAALRGARLGEVPITLHPDGRTAHRSHLRTFRDGWRHLRFFLMYSPKWLFLMPGALLVVLGLVGYVVAMPRLTLFGATFDVHTLLFASLAIILGYQSILFAFLTRIFGMTAGFLPDDPRIMQLFRFLNLERGLVIGAVTAVLGLGLLAAAVNAWRLAGFGALDYVPTMRVVIPGVTLTAIGVQTVFSSFFFSIIGLARR